MIVVSHGTKVEIFMKTNDLEFSKILLTNHECDARIKTINYI